VTRMHMLSGLLVAAGVTWAPLVPAAHAQDPPRTLVLPLRPVGVSDTTVAVVGDLLEGELEKRGVRLVAARRSGVDLPLGEAACDDADCAAAWAESLGAQDVVFGSLSRLRDKIFLKVRALHLGDAGPYYVDQLAATFEEDLDAVVRRAADGIAAGEADASRATIETITADETIEPRRRASRKGVGFRAGFLFPANGSYGDVDRLTCLRLAFKYESEKFLIDTTPVLGFKWRGETVEWTVLDVFAARIIGIGDYCPYLGAGLGVHALHVEETYLAQNGGYTYESSREQSETTLTADVGIGLLALRTYDFVLVTDVRYHFVFSDFDQVDGDGAHGILLSFGVNW